MDDFLAALTECADFTYLLNEPDPELVRARTEKQRVAARRGQARYRLSHPAAVRARHANYRGKGRTRPEVIEAQLAAQQGLCYWCGDVLGSDYHVDHIHPVTRGGSNDPDNLVAACPHCNESKGAKPLDEWLAWLNRSSVKRIA